jgi:hypothetical protein
MTFAPVDIWRQADDLQISSRQRRVAIVMGTSERFQRRAFWLVAVDSRCAFRQCVEMLAFWNFDICKARSPAGDGATLLTVHLIERVRLRDGMRVEAGATCES